MAIKPKALCSGDCIGVISPASPLVKENIKQFENGLIKLKKLGYKIILGQHTYYNYGYLAGTDKQRADDLMQLFQNKDISAIMCSRGGYGSARLLDYIDLNIIINNPKIFIGYSDITFLLNLFTLHTGLITFHGPLVKDIELNSNSWNTSSLLNTISKKKNMYTINLLTCCKPLTLIPGKCIGMLVGGNLTTLISTIGTSCEINTKDKVLLLEDVGESAYKVDRMLTILKDSGKLSDCSGIIIGDFTQCDESYGINIFHVIKEFLVTIGKPTILNMPVGHGDYNLTLPIGAKIELDTTNCKITVLEPVII